MQSTTHSGPGRSQSPHPATLSAVTAQPSAAASPTKAPPAPTLRQVIAGEKGHRPALLTPAQAAREVFGISERSFHELRKSAWMPKPVVLGPRLIRFVRVELEAACAAMPRGTVAEPGQLSRSRLNRTVNQAAGQ